jgi:hypothetical protein
MLESARTNEAQGVGLGLGFWSVASSTKEVALIVFRV